VGGDAPRLAHWLRLLEDLTPALDAARRRKFRRELWWIGEADDETQLRCGAASFCRRWRHRLRTTNLAEGFFRHLRRYLGRFPGCLNPAHSEHALGCFILACQQAQA
jgi:hypothetical protein